MIIIPAVLSNAPRKMTEEELDALEEKIMKQAAKKKKMELALRKMRLKPGIDTAKKFKQPGPGRKPFNVAKNPELAKLKRRIHL